MARRLVRLADRSEDGDIARSWFDAPISPTQKKICEDIQSYAFEQVPFIPIGQWFYPTAFRNNIVDIVVAPGILHWNLKKT